MSNESPASHRRPPKFVRIVRARPRLFMSALFALLIIAVLPSDWRMATRALVGWDVGVLLYLVAAFQSMTTSDTAHIRRRAALQDEGQTAILTLTTCAAIASMGAILALLGAPHGSGATRDPLNLLLAAATIVLSWALIHTIFALHYAHQYYGGDGNSPPPLQFHGEGKPDYWDFVYFSFNLGMTSQVSDVSVASKTIRRTVNVHCIIAFFFNVAVLALSVNITAGAL